MDKTKRFDSKSVLIVLAAIIMIMSLLFTSACSDGSGSASSSTQSSSSSSAEATTTDYQTIKNGDFEFQTDEKEVSDFPIASSILWTRSNDALATSANTSKYNSGIIDTSDDAYNAIAKDNAFPVKSGSGEDAVYFNPRTPEYYGLVEKSYTYDKNVKNSDGLPTSGNKVLMIHNEHKTVESRGTAQKFTSTTSVSVASGTYGHLSIWAMTKDLVTLQDTDEFGAYVSLTNTVSSQKSPLIIENIDTKGEWVQLHFYLEPSAYTTTSFKVVVGLGNGSSRVMNGYVEGFAYFDNIHYETISLEKYKQRTSAVNKAFSIFKHDGGGSSLCVDTPASELKENLAASAYVQVPIDNGDAKADGYIPPKTFTSYSYKLSYNINAIALLNSSNGEIQMTASKNDIYRNPTPSSDVFVDEVVYKAANPSNAFSTIKNNALLSDVKNPLGDDATTYYMLFSKGSSYKLTTESLSLGHGEFGMLSFYVKVKAKAMQTGLTVSFVDLGTATNPVETTTVAKSAFNTNSVDDENTEDWAKFTILISNDMNDNEDRNYRLEFDFGPTSATTNDFLLPEGYALMSGFEFTALASDQFADASISTNYNSTVSLGSDRPSGAVEEDAEDSYNLSYASSDNLKIETDASRSVIGYTGVVGGHTMVGGNQNAYLQDATHAGIINTKYFDTDANNEPDLGTESVYNFLTVQEKLSLLRLAEDNENKNIQPLIIKNTSATSYGYLGSSKSLASATTTMVSVKLRAFGGAKAYIYLVNADPLEGFNVLSIQADKWSVNADGITVDYDTDTSLFNKQYKVTVVESDCTSTVGGWITVNLIITAGNSALDYRVEVWNGSRDGAETSTGLIAIDSINISSPTISSVKNSVLAEYGDTAETIESISYTRAPSKVIKLDDKGKKVESLRTYRASEIYTEYKLGKTIIGSLATIDVENEIDETDVTTSSSSSAQSSTNTPASYSWALQLTSIIISVVLILLLIWLIIRMVIKDARAKRISAEQYYNQNSREQTQKKIAKAKKQQATSTTAVSDGTATDTAEQATDTDETAADDNASEEVEAEQKEYDYDNMENNISTDDENK